MIAIIALFAWVALTVSAIRVGNPAIESPIDRVVISSIQSCVLVVLDDVAIRQGVFDDGVDRSMRRFFAASATTQVPREHQSEANDSYEMKTDSVHVLPPPRMNVSPAYFCYDSP